MSNLLTLSGHAGLPLTPPSPLSKRVSIDVFRDSIVSGKVLVYSGFPLQPGMVFPSDLSWVRVLDENQQEVRVGVEALRGVPFVDGSIRSIGLQFLVNLDAGIENGKVYHVSINEAKRRLTRTWIEPVFDSSYPGFNITSPLLYPSAENNAQFFISASDAQYACDTFVACFPTKPESQDVEEGVKTFFKTAPGTTETFGHFREQVLTLWNGDAQGAGTTYEHVHSLYVGALRCEDGPRRRSYVAQATRTLKSQMGAQSSAVAARIGTSSLSWDKVYGGADPSLPAAASPTDPGLLSEANSGRYVGWIVGYWLTAWRQPWRKLAHVASAEIGNVTTKEATTVRYLGTNTGELVRFNCNRRITTLICAYIVDATMQVPGAYGSGRNNNTASFELQLPWIAEILEEYKYTTANYAAFADGIVGQRVTVGNGSPNSPGEFPSFMLAVSTVKMLHLYYNMIYPDPAIPEIITTIANFAIGQMYYDEGADYYGMPYWISLPPSSGWNAPTGNRGALPGDKGNEDWYYPAIWTETFALAFAFTKTTLYKTWALRCGRREQLLNPPGPNGDFIPTVKGLGEYFAGHQQSAICYIDGEDVRPIPGAHPVAIVNPPTHPS